MSDASDPLHESLREFLDAEKSRPDPSPEVQQRTFSRLSTTLGLQVGAGPTSSAPQSPPVSPPSTGHVLARMVAHGSRRGLATFLVGAAVGATAYGTVAHLQRESRVERAPAAAIPSRPPEPAPMAPELASEPRPTGEVAPRPAAAPPSTQRVSSEQETGRTKDQGLAAERKWIEMARTALARGRVDGALAALRHHARHYPGGQLAEERDSLLVQSLVAKGDYAQARTQAARFGQQHPNSLFSPAIAQALQSIP
jgi:hypothetical protein